MEIYTARVALSFICVCPAQGGLKWPKTVGTTAVEPPERVTRAGEGDAAEGKNTVGAQSPEGGGDKVYPRPTPTGPMVAVYLDEKSVATLQARYPDTREARLRKVVLQYGASDREHHVYEPLFGGVATVKLMGEASGGGRRALAASVSFAGEVVEPRSLSPAVDVTPGDEGGGPLGSAVLVEQLRRAKALKESSWKGTLPPMLVHHRHFPREDGVYKALDEPIMVTGSICRADWIDGASTRCRTTVAEGEERRGWSPSGCSLCNTLRSSPCCDIFARWEALSELVSEAEKASQETGQGSDESDTQGTGAEATESEPTSETLESDDREDREDRDEKKAARTGVADAAAEAKSAVDIDHSEGSVVDSPGEQLSSGEHSIRSEVEAAEERQKKLMEDMLAATVELRNCIDYHDVFVDAEADAAADES